MIIHLFNSSLVSGPETLVIPALPSLEQELGEIRVGFLFEKRKGSAAESPVEYARRFGLRTFSVAVRRQLDFKAVRELADQLERLRPTIVHAHDVKASTYLALAALSLRLRKKGPLPWKMVSTHHGVHARHGAKIRAYELFYCYVVLRFFDLVLCVCSSDREILLRRGLDPRRVQVHLNGIDREEITSAERPRKSAEIRREWESSLGIDLQSKAVFGMAARLSREKNHALLLDALSHLKRERPDFAWTCLCFGTGSLEEALRERTEELGLGLDVHWAGYRPGLSGEMAGFDILISLSLGEGLPINLLEAGWSGTPVLAVCVDGVKDLLIGNELQLFRLAPNPPAEAVALQLTAMMRDVKTRQLSGSVFQQAVMKNFSGKSWKKGLIEAYRKLSS
ncbi:MAG: glycosyltransferase family 4 protein [Oligoflexia bacterium]|nr:glycosyltransferase family 4 protein [Oligoflexia bacterium]